jgi:hypothetical protein
MKTVYGIGHILNSNVLAVESPLTDFNDSYYILFILFLISAVGWSLFCNLKKYTVNKHVDGGNKC